MQEVGEFAREVYCPSRSQKCSELATADLICFRTHYGRVEIRPPKVEELLHETVLASAGLLAQRINKVLYLLNAIKLPQHLLIF